MAIFPCLTALRGYGFICFGKVEHACEKATHVIMTQIKLRVHMTCLCLNSDLLRRYPYIGDEILTLARGDICIGQPQ